MAIAPGWAHLGPGAGYEGGTNHRSCNGAAVARPPPGDEYRFLLESCPAVAFRRDPKSPDQGDIPAQSGLAHDREENPAVA